MTVGVGAHVQMVSELCIAALTLTLKNRKGQAEVYTDKVHPGFMSFGRNSGLSLVLDVGIQLGAVTFISGQ